jgi:hypothetical protein
MRLISLVSCLIILFSSCKEEQVLNANGVLSRNEVDSFFQAELRSYDLNLSDSAKFVYAHNKAFDTAFFLVVKSQHDSISGTLYYYPPTYYQNFGDWDARDVFLFKCIKFKLSPKVWLRNYSDLNAIVRGYERKKKAYDNSGKIHPAHHKIFLNNTLYGVEDFSPLLFDSVYSYLDRNLIRQMIQRYPVVNGCIP